MERKIGEVFTLEGKHYEVCKTNKKGLTSCGSCDFGYCYCGNKWDEYIGECVGDDRSDNRDVVFKELVPNIKTFK